MQTSPNIMQTSQISPQHFTILLFDGYSNLCLANLIEPLRAANTLARRALYRWQFCTPDHSPVRSSSGLTIAPDQHLGQQSGQMLVVMPSYGYLDHDTPTVLRALQAAARQHDHVAGLDTGSWLLARAGLLQGYRATIHWHELPLFEEQFPDVTTEQERYVIDRDRLTCSGAMASFDFALALIRRDHGALLSMEVAHLLMSQDPNSQRSAPRLHNATPLVQQVVDIMLSHIETPLTIQQIAVRVKASQKQLETQIGKHLQITPQALYKHLRLSQARRLVEDTTQSIAEIASRCGYDSPSAMARAFKSEFGLPPSTLRRAG